MTVYVLQIILICIYAFIFLFSNKKKNKKVFIIMTFFTLVIVSSLRKYTVGYDNTQYMIAYQKASLVDLHSFSTMRYEYGFTLLLYLLNKITNNYQILFCLTSIFINYSVLKFIYKNSDNLFISVMLYILLNFYFFYTSAMRQAIAIAIILLGFDNIEKENWKKFIIYVLFACSFHMSSLLVLLLIPLKKVNYNKKFIHLIIFGYLISFVFGRQIYGFLMNFSDKLYNYGYSKFAETNYFGALLKFGISFIFFIIPFQLLRKFDNSIINNKQHKLNVYIGILAVANLFTLLTMKVGIFDRFSPFFTIYTIIWFPNIIQMIKDYKSRFIIYGISMIICSSYWLTICILRNEWLNMLPYKFFWQ